MLPKVIRDSIKVEETQSEISKWNFHDFRKYFEYLYQFNMKKPYIPVGGDLKQLSNLLKQQDNEVTKKKMEVFMENDYFEIKHLRVFCSSFSQSVLDSYLKTGKFPSKSKGKYEDSTGEDLDKFWTGVDDKYKGDE